jgi:hypothetical protein
MARSVAECNEYITSNLVTQFAAVGITINPTLWSTRNLLRLICYTIAIAQSLSEQLWDIALAKMEAVQEASSPASARWLQNAVFNFQYSSTTPQVLVVSNGVAAYDPVNEALRIVEACAVSSTIANTVLVKAAKNSPLEPLAVGELSSLQTYVDMIGTAGITYVVSSDDADKLYLEGTIYYQGAYSSVIEANVIAAIELYLTELSITRFGGDILMSDIEVMVRSIPGVNDVAFERVSVRYDSQTIHTGIDLVLAGDWVNRKYIMGAGYMVQEDTATYTFADKLTFVAE